MKFGCFSSFATSIVPELLEGFPRLHPGVDLDVTIGTNEELFDALEAGHVEVALVYNVTLPLGFRRRKIYATELEVHLHPEHPLTALEKITLADLAEEPFIQFDIMPGVRNVADVFAARGLKPRIEARVSQLSLVEALVARGMGYGLLMSRPNAFPVSIEGKPYVIRPLDPPATVTHVVAIWPEDMNLTPRASALLDFAVERLGGYGRADVPQPTHTREEPAR